MLNIFIMKRIEFQTLKYWYCKLNLFLNVVLRNGQLVKIEPWEVAVNTADKDDFARIVEFLKENVEETIWLKEDYQWAKWYYDHLTEEDQVSECLQQLSNHFPQTTIRCVKSNSIDFAYGDDVDSYTEFCGNNIDWKSPESHISEEDIIKLRNTIDSMWEPYIWQILSEATPK